MPSLTQAEAENTINRVLEPGESALWVGIPKRGFVLRGADIFLIPFSLMWCGFIVFWVHAAPLFLTLFAMPFILFGLYMVVGRFVVDARNRANSAYGLTDHRVIIVSGLLNRTTQSLQLKTLSEVTCEERTNGTGTISFGPLQTGARWLAGTGWPGIGPSTCPMFDMIPAAREVHGRIHEAQVAAGDRR